MATYSIKFTVSRGRDTYGYNICTLRDRTGMKVARTVGGGYDMVGTVLGEAMQILHQEELKAVAERFRRVQRGSNKAGDCVWESPEAYQARAPRAEQLYGGTAHYIGDTLTTVRLDGGCGLSAMQNIANAAGLQLHRLWGNKTTSVYELGVKE